MFNKVLAGVALSVLMAAPAAAEVKIGFITTLTTPAGVLGKDMQDAVNLAVEHIGGKIGDHEVKVIFEDDGFKPETGKQAADKLVQQDDVDFVAGFIWSHVLLASRKSVLDAGKFLISSNAGPSQLALRAVPSLLARLRSRDARTGTSAGPPAARRPSP